MEETHYFGWVLQVTAVIDGRYVTKLLSRAIVIRDGTELKQFHVGANPLLLNSMDAKSDIILDILASTTESRNLILKVNYNVKYYYYNQMAQKYVKLDHMHN